MKLLIVFIALIVVGCGYDKGECVWISTHSSDQSVPVKADYLKYGDRSHWYYVDGELRSILDVVSQVTICE